jgi:hypothetical protein
MDLSEASIRFIGISRPPATEQGRRKQQWPRSPGAIAICAGATQHSVQAQYRRRRDQCQGYLRRYFCVFSSVKSSPSEPTHRGRVDPAGFEPASATWTECCVASYTTGPVQSEQRPCHYARSSITDRPRSVRIRESFTWSLTNTFFRIAEGRVSHAVRRTSLGARCRTLIR